MKVSIFMCNSKVLTWGTVGTLTKHLERCLTFGDFSSRSCVADRGVYRGFFFLLQVKLVVLPWVLWCLDQSLPQLSRRWLGYVRFCFKKPSPHIPPPPPHPAAMNVSILFSWIVACTELMLSRHIFWLRICEKKKIFFIFDISLFSITTMPKI